MNRYFDDLTALARLRAELARWRGTPFRHAAAVRGGGVDCIHFVTETLIEIEALPASIRRAVPDYPRDWHVHQERELLLENIPTRWFAPVCLDEIRSGDLLIFRFGKCASHAALIFDGNLWHSIVRLGVVTSRADDPFWTGRLAAAFALIGRADAVAA
jgi:cell wall-associated NlpC family hydrolase